MSFICVSTTVFFGNIDFNKVEIFLVSKSYLIRNENDQVNNLSNKHLLGKIWTPKNVSEFVYYIISNTFITGANYIMDGGASIRLSTE